jgi:hypothetical protein
MRRTGIMARCAFLLLSTASGAWLCHCASSSDPVGNGENAASKGTGGTGGSASGAGGAGPSGSGGTAGTGNIMEGGAAAPTDARAVTDARMDASAHADASPNADTDAASTDAPANTAADASPSVLCGDKTCGPVAGLTYDPCCTTDGKCGLVSANPGMECFEVPMPGVLDLHCPAWDPMGISGHPGPPGCCHTDGTCGVLDPQLGCIRFPMAADASYPRCNPDGGA